MSTGVHKQRGGSAVPGSYFSMICLVLFYFSATLLLSLQPELGDFLSYPILTLTSTPVPSVRRKKKKVSSELLLILVSSFG